MEKHTAIKIERGDSVEVFLKKFGLAMCKFPLSNFSQVYIDAVVAQKDTYIIDLYSSEEEENEAR